MRAPAETPPSDVAQPPPSPRTGGRGWLREQLPAFVVVAVAGALVAAFFLGLYWAKHYDMPIGWDTPRYLDQANLVAAHGLAGVPDELPPPIKTLPSRGGTPIVLLTLSSLFGVSTFKVAAVVPPAAAMALALAAGALVTWTLRRGPWSLAAVALLVGTSAVVIRLMAPETYADNLFAAAILTAALVPLLASAVGGGGFVAAVILIGAGAIAHSASFAVVALALVLGALVLLPGSVRSWRRGELSPFATPSARIAGAVAGGGAIAAAAIFGVLRAAPDTPKLSRGELVKKLRDDVPLYRYWLTAPLAALGAVALWRAPRSGWNGDGDGAEHARPARPGAARILLLFLLSWVAIALAGVALYLAGRNSPAHRFLSFLVPLPILVAVGVLWLGRLAGARAGRAAGAVVVIAAVLVLGGPRVPRPLHDPRRPLPRRRVARRGQGPGRRDRCRVPRRGGRAGRRAGGVRDGRPRAEPPVVRSGDDVHAPGDPAGRPRAERVRLRRRPGELPRRAAHVSPLAADLRREREPVLADDPDAPARTGPSR